MKDKHIIQLLNGGCQTIIGTLGLLFIMYGIEAFAGQGDNINTNACVDDEVVTAIDTLNSNKPVDNLGKLVQDAFAHRQKIIQELLNIVNNPQSNLYVKCCAANCLGEMRASEAAESLAAQITINPPGDMGGFHFVPTGGYMTAVSALIKIGTPAIPAVIRNLAGSDDEQVRAWSLTVLNTIDGDKNVVQLRLQGFLEKETDQIKKDRIQSALEAEKNLQNQK